MYVLVENGKIVKTCDNIKKEFPSTSFPKNLPDEYKGWIRVKNKDKEEERIPEGKKLVSTKVQLVKGEPEIVNIMEDLDEDSLYVQLDRYRRTKSSSVEFKGHIVTARADQRADLMYLYTLAQSDQWGGDVQWYEVGQGTLSLGKQDIIKLWGLVNRHRQDCFTAFSLVFAEKGKHTNLQSMVDSFDNHFFVLNEKKAK